MAKSKSGESATQQGLKAICDRVRTLLATAERNDILARYEVAVLVKGVKDSAKYGEDAISKMALALRRDRSVLYRYAAVADTWTKAEFKELVAKSKSDESTLTWSHLELLAAVEDGRVRRALVERSQREAMTLGQLRALRKNHPESEPSTPSNELASRMSSADLAHELGRWVGEFEQEVSSWGGRLMGDVGVAKMELDDGAVITLGQTVDRMAAVAKSMQEMALKLKHILHSMTPAAPGMQVGSRMDQPPAGNPLTESNPQAAN